MVDKIGQNCSAIKINLKSTHPFKFAIFHETYYNVCLCDLANFKIGLQISKKKGKDNP